MKENKFPPEIEELILKRQLEAGNKADINVFYELPQADEKRKGFNWDATVEGDLFWREILIHENYKPFYEKYPQTTQEYKGYIKGYPKEIVDRILELIPDKNWKGYDSKLNYLEELGLNEVINWDKTPEGHYFWHDIYFKKFETFYNKYPKDTQNINNNNEKNNKIQESNREQGSKGIACYRTPNQARTITIGSKYSGDATQNRVVKSRFSECKIRFESKFQ